MTFFAKTGIERWYRNEDREWTVDKREDERKVYTQDWADLLGTDTIASVAWDVSGPTNHGTTNTTTKTTIDLSGTGWVEVTITTAAGAIHQICFVFRGIDSTTRRDGYR